MIKTTLGYLIIHLAKKPDERKELDPKPFKAKEDLNKIESNQFVDVPKVDEHVNNSNILKNLSKLKHFKK